MALNTRIRSKWKKSGRETTLGENSVALAYIVWQIALTTAKNLHKEDFEYESDDQRIDIIAEIMIFDFFYCNHVIFINNCNDISLHQFQQRIASI